jgi:hypothetical protein
LVLMGGDVQLFCFDYYHFVMDLGHYDNNIYIFSTAFLFNNRGKFVSQRYGVSFKGIKTDADIVKRFYNIKRIVSFSVSFPNQYQVEQIGIMQKIVSKNLKINYLELYEQNKRWFSSSQLLNHYDDRSFVNLSNRGLKEFYCNGYLNLAVNFYAANQKALSKRTMTDMAGFCQLSDFSALDSSNLYLNLQSKLRFVKD